MSETNIKEHLGVTAEDMTLEQLKALCEQNKIDIKGLTTKPKILKAIKKWEETLLKTTEKELSKRGATSKAKTTVSKEVEAPEVEIHEHKKVVSKTDVTHNGVDYTDILVEGGITFRVPKKKK